jgi:hypothetical protein
MRCSGQSERESRERCRGNRVDERSVEEEEKKARPCGGAAELWSKGAVTMIRLKQKKEATEAAAAAAAAAATSSSSSSASSSSAAAADSSAATAGSDAAGGDAEASGGGGLKLLGIGGKGARTGTGAKTGGKKRTPGEIRIQKGEKITAGTL